MGESEEPRPSRRLDKLGALLNFCGRSAGLNLVWGARRQLPIPSGRHAIYETRHWASWATSASCVHGEGLALGSNRRGVCGVAGVTPQLKVKEAWASRLPHSSSLSLSQVIASGTQEACPARVLPQRRGEERRREARRGQGRAALGRPGGTVAGIWAPTQTISGLAARAGSR